MSWEIGGVDFKEDEDCGGLNPFRLGWVGLVFTHSRKGRKVLDFFRGKFSWDNRSSTFCFLDISIYLSKQLILLHANGFHVRSLDIKRVPFNNDQVGYLCFSPIVTPIEANQIMCLLLFSNNIVNNFKSPCWSRINVQETTLLPVVLYRLRGYVVVFHPSAGCLRHHQLWTRPALNERCHVYGNGYFLFTALRRYPTQLTLRCRSADQIYFLPSRSAVEVIMWTPNSVGNLSYKSE